MSDPIGYEANLERGIVLREHGRFQEAVACFARAIASSPDIAEPYYEQAACFCWMGKSRDAVPYIERARALAPQEAYYLVLHAWIESREPPNPARALSLIEQALEIDPQLSAALLMKAHIHGVMGQSKLSERAAREALRLDPDNDHVANLLALALQEQGRIDESRRVVEQVLRLVPEDSFSHANAGWLALRTGKYEIAYAEFREAMRLDPTMLFARRGMFRVLIQRVLIHRLFLRFRSFYLKSTLPHKMVFFGLLLFFPSGLLAAARSVVRPGIFWLGWNAVTASLGAGLFLIYFRSLGKLWVHSHPLVRHVPPHPKKSEAIFTYAGFFGTVLVFCCLEAWYAAAIALLLALDLFLGIRWPGGSRHVR
jgi:Tfp pilus assembly protein PilF